MPWRMDCNAQALGLVAHDRASQINQIDYLAEIILPPSSSDQAFMQA
jgi:hypothetical protein